MKQKKTLLNTNVYTQHKLPTRNFKRRKIIVGGIDVMWQADLVDVQKIKYQNSHNNYILTVIDCFSKYAWAEPIKNKTAVQTYQAFKNIIEKSGRTPQKLIVDGGNEFKGQCKKYLEGLGINLFISESDLKASLVERFNRTIKERIWRMFTFNKNKKYIENLQDLLYNYNNSYHSSIKNKPSAINKSNEFQTFKNLYGYDIKKGPKDLIEFRFKKGDYVRSVIPKSLFEKGYTIKWTEDIFIINETIPSHPPTYTIITLHGDIILNKTNTYQQIFYGDQLQLVYKDEFPIDTFRIIDQAGENIQIQKLNSENQQSIWTNKKDFLNG